jgi:hypothetical protein
MAATGGDGGALEEDVSLPSSETRWLLMRLLSPRSGLPCGIGGGSSSGAASEAGSCAGLRARSSCPLEWCGERGDGEPRGDMMALVAAATAAAIASGFTPPGCAAARAGLVRTTVAPTIKVQYIKQR